MQSPTRSQLVDDLTASGNGNGWATRRAVPQIDGDGNPRARGPCVGDARTEKAENQERINYAQLALEEMVLDAIRKGSTGTLSVEIPVKDGRLGRVKQMRIDYQPE
jgi:hypothetical protein